MKLTIEKTNKITDISTWLKYAQPEGGEKQWKDGRSAKEFARYMTGNSGNLPSAIETYLKSIGCKSKQGEIICIPEAVTDFGEDFGSGGVRHHDALLVLNDIVVGIEAKVFEPFDKTVEKWLEEGLSNKDGGDNRRKRLSKSLELIKGDPNLSDDYSKILYYQLISATVGTILEAERNSKDKACLLIIEFTGDVNKEKDYDAKIQTNDKAYSDYLEYLGLSDKKDTDRYIDVKYAEKNIRVYFKKISIEIAKGGYSYSLQP